jgi:hypothetical protein
VRVHTEGLMRARRWVVNERDVATLALFIYQDERAQRIGLQYLASRHSCITAWRERTPSHLLAVLNCAPIFGVVCMSIEQFEEWSLIIGLGGLILLMVFIVWNLGRESKAGKFGMFVLFLALALGLLGFVIKLVLVEILQP